LGQVRVPKVPVAPDGPVMVCPAATVRAGQLLIQVASVQVLTPALSLERTYRVMPDGPVR
jgi:hypothetical protein